MFYGIQIFPQNSFGLSGYRAYSTRLTTPDFNLESNPSFFSNLNDWGISFSYGAEFSNEINPNIYSISIAKSIDNHSFTARYTPGYQKEFFFSTGETIITNDTSVQSLKANFNYRELFGLGYSYKISNRLSAGMSLRYFSQQFERETVTPVIGDPITLQIETVKENVNFWKSDLGLVFNAADFFTLRIESINLLNFGEHAENSEFKNFEIIRDKEVLTGFNYRPFDALNFDLAYESSNSFQFAVSGYLSNLFFGITTFHDKYQDPFIAGIIPSISYKSGFYELMLSGVKYFSDRSEKENYDRFAENGIHNIINNPYSFDKILLSVSFNLNTTPVQKVRIIDVKINGDIFPAIPENYLADPFAFILAVNVSGEVVDVVPSVKIEGLNYEPVQSPAVRILPGDSISIPVKIITPDDYNSEKPSLSYADFYLSTNNKQPDDQLQKPVLVNGINAWDGKVSNLKYFMRRDPEFTISYSRTVLGNYKEQLDTLAYALSTFYKAKFIFDDFAGRMVYSSDPRATAEYVQFPKQTIELKGGDCDDLSVCYSAFLESVGIQTAFVDYKPDNGFRHVQVIFNTKLSPDQAGLITNNDQKYFVRKNREGQDEIWIPVETTTLTNFYEAWNSGAEKFRREAVENLGLASGKVVLTDIN